MSALEQPHDHFESLERQAHAARLGMWVFVASEVLLFTALFALYLTYRAHYPAEFHAMVRLNTKVLASINTGILLVSSTLVAGSVHALRAARPKLAGLLVAGTACLGAVFLVIKMTEYGEHFHDGIYPGGTGAFFVTHGLRGPSEFWTLYYTMTALHALHVTIGIGVLGVTLLGLVRGTIGPAHAHRLEVAAIYWHLVDLVWIFLWPLFYLA